MTVDELRAALTRHGPLLNQQQVAARLGLTPGAITARRAAGTIAEPVARDDTGRPLWLPEQIE